MSDNYFDRAGARIAYQFTGSGKPFGYAHGVLLSRAAVKRLQLFDLDAFAHRRVLTYDQRGHGQSTGRPVASDYHFDVFAADLLGLLDSLDLAEPIDFAGSSLGCATVLRAAVTAPERFDRLILMIPPVAWESGARPAHGWYTDTAEAIETSGAPQWRQDWADAEPLPIFADYPKYDMTPDVDDALLAPIMRGIGMSDLPAPDEIAALDHPTLIVTWDTDPLHPIATAQRLRDLMPNSTLHVARSVPEIHTWTDRISRFLER